MTMTSITSKRFVRSMLAALSLTALCASTASAGPTDVRDVDQPARNPYVMVTTTLTNTASQIVGTVPSEHRFVIEYVSASCSSPTAVAPTVLRLTAAGQADHYFAPTIYSGGYAATVSQMTRIYAGPKSNVILSVFPTTASTAIYCNVTLSGHLVSLVP